MSMIASDEAKELAEDELLWGEETDTVEQPTSKTERKKR